MIRAWRHLEFGTVVCLCISGSVTVKCIESDSEIPTTDLAVTKNVTSVSLKCGNVNTQTQISCPAQDDHFSTIYIIVRAYPTQNSLEFSWTQIFGDSNFGGWVNWVSRNKAAAFINFGCLIIGWIMDSFGTFVARIITSLIFSSGFDQSLGHEIGQTLPSKPLKWLMVWRLTIMSRMCQHFTALVVLVPSRKHRLVDASGTI